MKSSELKEIILETVDNIQSKEEEYKEYIDKHINNVKQSFEDLLRLVPSNELPELLQDEETIQRLRMVMDKHDNSKYSDLEFEGYRKHFYPVDDTEKLNTEEYELAWLHHYSNNPHHWEYWCVLDPETGEFKLQDNIDEIDYMFYEVERVMDWCAMSRQFNNRVKQWYSENSDRIIQPDFVKNLQTKLLDLVDIYNIDVIGESNGNNKENNG